MSHVGSFAAFYIVVSSLIILLKQQNATWENKSLKQLQSMQFLQGYEGSPKKQCLIKEKEAVKK